MAEQRHYLQQHSSVLQDPVWTEAVAAALKQQADHFLRTDLEQARQLAHLLLAVAQLSQQDVPEALGRRALGNVLMIGEGRSQDAIEQYRQAAAIYEIHQRPVEAAQSQIGVIGGLYLLGRYEEAVVYGGSLRQILLAHEQWPALTGLLLNLANIHRRLGQGQQALALLDEAQDICQKTEAERERPGIMMNRANVLRDLGQLPESLQASRQAEDLFRQRDQLVGAAQARMSQAITRFWLGQYNEALSLFDGVRSLFLADGRSSYAILVERFVSDLLLQVGHFRDVLQKSEQVRQQCQQQGLTYEVAQAWLDEAAAYAGLRQYRQAVAALATARQLFAKVDNEIGVARADLETAAINYQQGSYESSLTTAVACAAAFQQRQHTLQAAQANLLAARAAVALARYDEAAALAQNSLIVSERQSVPWLNYQAHHILGLVAQAQGLTAIAAQQLDEGIHQLEQLRGRLMVEFRADFLLDKNRIYEDRVALCLQVGQPNEALQYVERTKSRALVDLVAHQLDLRIQPHDDGDRPLVTKLELWRDQRNQLHRRLAASQEAEVDLQARLAALEKQIADAWHELLVRNAAYAREAALLSVRTEPIQPHLADGTLLLEFFVVHGELIVLLVSSQAVKVCQLPGVYRQLVQPSRFLQVNLKAATSGATDVLLAGAKKQLKRLYHLLLEPIQNDMMAYDKLLIVPHSAVLHYLPFQALYDGQHYLIEKYEVSYLPAASLLHYENRPPAGGDMVAFGYDCDGRLPQAPQEAELVASLLNGRVYSQEAATLGQFQQQSHQARVLHLATHGDFNQANPLFSGLTLANGQLNTLDIFHLRLSASLVTLSACQTGRSVVSGGDELLGLMRAFLYAGASSLLLSLWQVNDASTMEFMRSFYQCLAEGHSKGAALRLTQREFCGEHGRYSHPYYWAPFFLVGETAPL